MRIVVCVKEVIDARLPVQLTPEGKIDTMDCIYILNPSDRCALEEALGIKKRWAGSSIVVVTVSPAGSEGALRWGLASGADEAIQLVVPPNLSKDAFAVAANLAIAMNNLNYDLIFCGDRSLDEATGAVGPALAEFLGLPQITSVVRLQLQPEEACLTAERRLERGDRQIVACPIPAVVTFNSMAAEPHYVSWHQYLLAMRRKIEYREIEPSELHKVADTCSGTTSLASLSRPRPRVKKNPTSPSSSLSARDRLDQMIFGAEKQEVKSSILGGEIETIAADLVRYLEENSII